MSSIDELQASRLPPKRRRSLTTAGIPWYRDLKVLQIISQVVFVIVFVGGLGLAFFNLARNLADSNLSLDFGVFTSRFGAEVSEGIRFDAEWEWAENLGVLSDYLAASTMTRAIITGIYNTLRVVILAVIASTILGTFVGIGLLSKNYLVRNVSKGYVEVFRNTPLLVQLIFIQRGMRELLPEVRNSYASPEQIGFFDFHEYWYVLNVRGISIPALRSTDTTLIFYGFLLVGAVIAYMVRRWRLQVEDQTGAPAYTWRYIGGIMLLFGIVGWLAAGGYPLSSGPYNVEYPQFGRFNIEGGYFTSLSFFSLFLGLTLYTAAFIADIVRAGIQAVPYGQIEAARSQGLSNSQVLSLVVLPQALRLIIPPLGNQYVNLGKNSSLGIAVEFFDTYFVVQLANNESGQAVPFFFALMIIYLSISLSLSLMTNLVNRTTTVKVR